jgi:hypothetical protein
VHSGARNIDVLFFMLGWDRFGFHKKHTGTRYAELVFLHPLRFVGPIVHSGSSGGAKRQHTIFHARVGPVQIPQKAPGHVTLNWCFASSGIRGSRSAVWYVRWHKTLTHYFPCSGGTSSDSTKSALGHVTPNLCLFIWRDLRIT